MQEPGEAMVINHSFTGKSPKQRKGGGGQKRPPGTGLHCPVRVNSSQWAPPAGLNLSGQKLGGRKVLSIRSPASLSAEVPPPGTGKTKSGQALMSHTAGKFLLHTCMLEMTAEITLKTGDTHTTS